MSLDIDIDMDAPTEFLPVSIKDPVQGGREAFNVAFHAVAYRCDGDPGYGDWQVVSPDGNRLTLHEKKREDGADEYVLTMESPEEHAVFSRELSPDEFRQLRELFEETLSAELPFLHYGRDVSEVMD